MWTFLLQTISVSLVALFLLFIKRIFEDKLSPRWQYAVWILLAIRILIPVSITNYILLPIPHWIEGIKTVVEYNVQSAYSSAYVPITTRHQLLSIVLNNRPQSITDWIFIIYLLGIFCTLFWYIVSYCRLRQFLKRIRGNPIAFRS